MIEQCLLNKNENTILSKFKNFLNLKSTLAKVALLKTTPVRARKLMIGSALRAAALCLHQTADWLDVPPAVQRQISRPRFSHKNKNRDMHAWADSERLASFD